MLDDLYLRQLRDAAVNAGIAQPQHRSDLLYGIMPRVTSNIPGRSAPGDQILVDLRELNRYTSLPDGSVPLLTWLQNAVDKTFALPEMKVFEAAIQKLSAETRTTNRPVDTRPKDGGNERVIHRDDMLDFLFLDKGYRVGASVAKMLVTRYVNSSIVPNNHGDPTVGSGTCWLITDNLLLTNHHVINERDHDNEFASDADFALQAKGAVAEFDYDSPSSTIKQFTMEGLVTVDRALDYALLRTSEATYRPPLPISRAVLSPNPGEYISVNIIQHPNGKPKRIAIRNNLVNSADGDSVTYFTDTLRGSSGSPVLNDNWQVVALHRGWQPVVNVNFQGKDTAYANYGTHILRILQHIRDHAPEAWNEIRQTHASSLDNI